MGLFQITGVPLSYKRNNVVPLPQDMRNPPVESWFMVNAKDLVGTLKDGYLRVLTCPPGREGRFQY
jgi:hypothetical protein